MPPKNIEAGSTVVSECQTCKGPMGHVVIAIVDGTVAKVQCKICGGRHAFRPVKKTRKPSSTGKSKVSSSKKDTRTSLVTQEWQSRTQAVDPERIKPYAMDAVFNSGDVLDHFRFGRGFVQRTIKPDKMEVLFEDSLKILRCHQGS